MAGDYSKIQELLGAESDLLLNHVSGTISKNDLQLPGPDFVDRVMANSDRNPRVLRSLQTLYGHGRLAGTGYVLDIAGRSGDRAFSGCEFCSEPYVFRS
jgi:class I fructose-bisphosphate aldolase